MLKINFANNWSKPFLRFIRWADLVCGTWYKIVSDRMGVRKWAKRTFAPLAIGIKNQMFVENPEVGILIPINWFDSCNDSFFADMKPTLHKSQVHSYSIMQWWACCSHMCPPLPAEAGCEIRERIVLLMVFTA